MLRLGQMVTRCPQTIGSLEKNTTALKPKSLRGRVVYIHPKGRFHVVEFENNRGDKMRESFHGVE